MPPACETACAYPRRRALQGRGRRKSHPGQDEHGRQAAGRARCGVRRVLTDLVNLDLDATR